MLHLAKSAPWYFRVLWGIFGMVYMSRLVIKSTSNDPMILRISGVLWAILLGIVAIDNLVIGKVIYIECWSVVIGWTSTVLLILTLVLTYIGGYQKSIRPDFDPKKRRAFVQSSCALLAAFIFFGLLFLGFYIYDYYSK